MNFKLFLGIVDVSFRVYWFSTTPSPGKYGSQKSLVELFIIVLKYLIQENLI